MYLLGFGVGIYSFSARSGQGATVISILIDLNGFLSYENREMLLAGNEAIG